MKQSPPLFPGASPSVLDPLLHMFDWFTSHPSKSKQAFSENLDYLHKYILPQGNFQSHIKRHTHVSSLFWFQKLFIMLVQMTVSFFGSSTEMTISVQNVNRTDSKGTTKESWHVYQDGHLSIYHYSQEWWEVLEQQVYLKLFRVIKDIEQLMLDKKLSSKILTIHQSGKTYSDDGLFLGHPRGLLLSLCLDGLKQTTQCGQ